LNDQVGAFDGETLSPLVGLFEKIGRPFPKPDSPAFANLPKMFDRFRTEVERLELRLSLKDHQALSNPVVEGPMVKELPLGLHKCDVPQTLRRDGYKNPVFIRNDAYWDLMEALIAAWPNSIAEGKLQHLFPHRSDRDNSPKKLRQIIGSLGLTVKTWTLMESND
jgi:hypothetical protein